MRIGFTLILLGLIFIAPFWLYLPLMALGIIFFPLYLESVVLGLLVDTLYGGSTGFSFFFGFIAAGLVFFAAPLREYLRFHA